MLRLRLAEPVKDVLRRYLANIRDFRQFFHRCVHQLIQISKLCRQNLTGFCSYLPDAQRVNQPADILLLTGLDG